MQRRIFTWMALTLVVLATALPAHAQRGGGRTGPAAGSWELLGETRVGFGVDRDVISLGRSDADYRNRSYDRLRLTAERGDVRFRAVRVRYINGAEENLPLDRFLRAGESVEIALPERRSFMSQIEMIYSADRDGQRGGMFDRWRQPRVKVFGFNRGSGLPPVMSGPRPNWTLLGENTVSFRGSRDVIRLGNDEGWYRTRSFDKLHFVVSEGNVQLEDIRIVYINGYAETVRVGRDLRQGTDLTVDLPGERSYLRQIEMRYRSLPGSAQRGLVKVFGEGRGR